MSLIDDTINYILSFTVMHNCSSVCKKWHQLITNNSIRCTQCNKIIKIYDTELYVTDDYYLECHTHPFYKNIYKIHDIKELVRICKIDKDKNFVITINKKGIQCIMSLSCEPYHRCIFKYDGLIFDSFTYITEKIIIFIKGLDLYKAIDNIPDKLSPLVSFSVYANNTNAEIEIIEINSI